MTDSEGVYTSKKRGGIGQIVMNKNAHFMLENFRMRMNRQKHRLSTTFQRIQWLMIPFVSGLCLSCEGPAQSADIPIYTPILPTDSQHLHPFPYMIDQPAQRVELFDSLEEVSGMVWLSDQRLALVQDEEGLIFEFDLQSQRVVSVRPFGPRGDYEGMALSDSVIYVLESNGFLHALSLRSGNTLPIQRLNLPKSCDAEGVVWDGATQRFLITCKEPTGSGSGKKYLRQVFAYQPAAKSATTLAAAYDLRQLAAYDANFPIGKKPFRADQKRSFMPSGIAIHPLTQDRYILSATGQVLMVVDTQEVLRAMVRLPKKVYPQAEGICFAPNGDLFISSEGRGNEATLMYLPYIIN